MTLQDTYYIRPCYQDAESKKLYLIHRNKHREAARMRRQKKYGPNERTDQNSIKRTTQNGDKQSVRCRIQATGHTDTEGLWYFNSIQRTQAEMKDY